MAKDKTPSSNTDLLLYALAIFVPPASVFIKRGCGADVIINIALCILGWLPAVIHAWWLVSKYPDNQTRVADVPPSTTPYHEHAARHPAPGATVPAQAPTASAPPSYYAPPQQGVPPPVKS